MSEPGRGRETRRKSIRVAQSHAASDTGSLLTRTDAQSPEAPFKSGEGRAVPRCSASAASSRARRRIVFVALWPTRKGVSHAAVCASTVPVGRRPETTKSTIMATSQSEGAIGPAHGLVEGEQELGLRARADPV